MDLSELTHIAAAEVERRLARGMAAWGVPEPKTLEEWARNHFYLSAESSYVEQAWTPWTFQRAIMACISNDDIYEIDFKKSARVGYTKILLAAMGYFAEHKRRNQTIWQPTDDDAEDFVKSELDPMLRDVDVMKAVFPAYLAKHKDNTLQQKKFVGSITRVRGGKAAKNYRRFSCDVAYLDELSAFDADVEKEGSPFINAAKRVEGATFPKVICGSTPKLKGFCLIDARHAAAEHRFTFQVPCPHCGGRHALTWGGKDHDHGFKWADGDPTTARHLCPHCGTLIDQGEYLAVEAQGIWINEDGTLWIHPDGRFTDPEGNPVPAPRHIAFHVWTAYSPAVAWADIVRTFLNALSEFEQGRPSSLKSWTNTTRGEVWEEEVERNDANDLKARAEPFPLKQLPKGCLLLLCGGDTQDNRVELGVWGYGLGGEMWTIDHQIFFGSPGQDDVWRDVEDFLFGTEYPNAFGQPQRIYATAIDSGGHHADDVYAFAHKHKARRVHAIKGASGRERSIENGNTRVAYKHNGRIEKHGPILWHVGTNLAKDRFQARLDISRPGPGYVHMSADLTDEWFRQLAGEARAARRTQSGTETRWTAERKRIEAKDCVTYAIWLEERLGLWAAAKRKWWAELEAVVQPLITDLFADPPATQYPAPTPIQAPTAPAPLAPPPADASLFAPIAF